MNATSERTLTTVLHGIIMERQRLLIREANYLRGLVGLPPVRADASRNNGAGVARRQPRAREVKRRLEELLVEAA